jgi:tetratricopeptide (TPR) repeat protein
MSSTFRVTGATKDNDTRFKVAERKMRALNLGVEVRLCLVLLVSLVCVGSLFAQSAEQLALHTQKAKAAESQHDYKTAVVEYGALARLLPENPQIRTNLGIALYLSGHWSEALSEFESAIKRAPELFPPRLFAGLSLYRLGRPDRAGVELTRAIHIEPSDPLAHLWLGYVRMAQSRYLEAVEALNVVRAAQPGNIDALYTLGKAHLELARLDTEKLFRSAPNGGRAWQFAAEQYRTRGNSVKALQLYEGAYERRPDIVEVRTAIQQLGGTLPVLHDAPPAVTEEDDLFRVIRESESRARDAFEQLSRRAPDSYRVHEVLADALVVQDRNQEAISEYQVVLKLKPDLPGIHEAIGNQFLNQGKATEAVPEFEAELKLQPESATAHLDLARALLVLGNETRAENLLRSAAGLDRPPAGIYKLLAKVYLRRHDNQKAISMLERYTKLIPADSSAHYLLSRAYRTIDNKVAARREIALYQRLSIDGRNRTSAQQALEALKNQAQEPDSDSQDGMHE